MLSLSLMAGCVSTGSSELGVVDSPPPPQASYRGLSVKEAQLQETGAPAEPMLLGDVSVVDGELWFGRQGLTLAMRSGRPTLVDGMKFDSFRAYALQDPVDDWLRALGSAKEPPSVGSETIRYLLIGGNERQPLIEHRRILSITRSYGDQCQSLSTDPCWVVVESVWFENSSARQKAFTYIDALTHEVTSVKSPLPDNYNEIRWTRIR